MANGSWLATMAVVAAVLVRIGYVSLESDTTRAYETRAAVEDGRRVRREMYHASPR